MKSGTENFFKNKRTEQFTPSEGQVIYLHAKILPLLPTSLIQQNPKSQISSRYIHFDGPSVRISSENENGYRRITITKGTKSVSYLDNPNTQEENNRSLQCNYPLADQNTFQSWSDNITNSMLTAEKNELLDWVPISTD